MVPFLGSQGTLNIPAHRWRLLLTLCMQGPLSLGALVLRTVTIITVLLIRLFWNLILHVVLVSLHLPVLLPSLLQSVPHLGQLQLMVADGRVLKVVLLLVPLLLHVLGFLELDRKMQIT